MGKKRKSVKRLQSKGKMICRVGKVKAEIRKKKEILLQSKNLFLVCSVSCHHLSLSSSFLFSLSGEREYYNSSLKFTCIFAKKATPII